MKKIMIIFFMLLITTGCNNVNYNEMGLEYLEDKYQDTFVYDGAYGNSMTGDHSFVVSSDYFPEEFVLIKMTDYKSDERQFFDNYIAVQYHQEVTDFIHDKATLYLGDTHIDMSRKYLRQLQNLDSTIKFKEFLNNDSTVLDFVVYMKESDLQNEEQITAFYEDLQTYNINIAGTIFVVKDDQLNKIYVEEINLYEYTLQEYFNSNDFPDGTLIKQVNF